MEGDGKKRKMEYEEEDEEAKIAKFFALIRSAREVRDLLRANSNNNGSNSKEKNDQTKIEEEAKAPGAWNPAFQPEDFLEDDKSVGHHGAGPSKTEEDEDKKDDKGDNGLDLKLSL